MSKPRCQTWQTFRVLWLKPVPFGWALALVRARNHRFYYAINSWCISTWMCAVRLCCCEFKTRKIMFNTFKMRAVALVGASNHPSRLRRHCCCCCCCCHSPCHHHHYEKECPIACSIPLSCHSTGNATVLMVCIIYVRCSQSKMNMLWFFSPPLLLPRRTESVAEVILPYSVMMNFRQSWSFQVLRGKNYILIIWYSIKYLLNTAQCGASSAISWGNMPQIAHLD